MELDIQLDSCWLPPWQKCHYCTVGGIFLGWAGCCGYQALQLSCCFSSLAACRASSGIVKASSQEVFQVSNSHISPCDQSVWCLHQWDTFFKYGQATPVYGNILCCLRCFWIALTNNLKGGIPFLALEFLLNDYGSGRKNYLLKLYLYVNIYIMFNNYILFIKITDNIWKLLHHSYKFIILFQIK